jgi:hypothetical protein
MRANSNSSADEPLSLSVHSLPDPALIAMPASGRGKFVAIFLACSLPLLLAVFVFFVFKPSGQVGYGSLIHPARPVPSVSVTTLDQQPFALDQLKGQWLLVNVGTAACSDECAQQLFIQKQMREMLNKDKDRVDRVWLLLDDGPIREEVKPLLADTQVLRVSEAEVKNWLLGELPLQEGMGQLFVVDPQGFAMLRMPTPTSGKEASAAKSVLQKLLAASAVWDKPGR